MSRSSLFVRQHTRQWCTWKPRRWRSIRAVSYTHLSIIHCNEWQTLSSSVLSEKPSGLCSLSDRYHWCRSAELQQESDAKKYGVGGYFQGLLSQWSHLCHSSWNVWHLLIYLLTVQRLMSVWRYLRIWRKKEADYGTFLRVSVHTHFPEENLQINDYSP